MSRLAFRTCWLLTAGCLSPQVRQTTAYGRSSTEAKTVTTVKLSIFHQNCNPVFSVRPTSCMASWIKHTCPTTSIVTVVQSDKSRSHSTNNVATCFDRPMAMVQSEKAFENELATGIVHQGLTPCTDLPGLLLPGPAKRPLSNPYPLLKAILYPLEPFCSFNHSVIQVQFQSGR